MGTETWNEVDRYFTQRLALDDAALAAAQAKCQTVGSKGYDGFAVALVVTDPAARS